jgi:hypothetical protein
MKYEWESGRGGKRGGGKRRRKEEEERGGKKKGGNILVWGGASPRGCSLISRFLMSHEIATNLGSTGPNLTKFPTTSGLPMGQRIAFKGSGDDDKEVEALRC